MIIARFNCPACETPIEAPVEAVDRGIKCPSCEIGFVPEKFETADEAVDPSFSKGDSLKVGQRPAVRPEDKELIEEERKRRQAQKERDELKQKWRQYHGLIEDAGNCFMVGIISLVVCVITTIVGFVNDDNAVAFCFAGGAMSLAVIFLFFCQCLHIRAGLEKLSIKD